MYYMDIYGQPIQFTYKKSSVFGTVCGLITSFIVVVFIVVYIILYCIDLSKMEMPIVLNMPENFNSPPKYELWPDMAGSKGEDVLPDLYLNNTQSGFLQLMIGLRHKALGFTLLDNPGEIIKAINKIGDENKPLSIANCKRMPFIRNDSFDIYNLNNTYCIYSPLILEGDSTSPNHSYVKIRLEICPVARASPDSTAKEASIETRSSITCALLNRNLTNYELYFMYINTIFNQTNVNEPIVRYVDWKSIELSQESQATISAYFQINKLTSFTNIMPKSITTSNVTVHYVDIDDAKYTSTPKERTSQSTTAVLITIHASDSRNQFERTYPNLFDILGKIGGFSKIIFLIGSVFVFFFAKTRLRESLINDFYSVVDPIYTDKVNKDFNAFLQELKDGTYEYSTDEKVAKNEKVLCDFYKKNDFVMKLLIVQTKINKNQIEATEKAEYNIARIVYQLYVNVIYSGLHYNTRELLANLFAFCCLTKRLRDKNIVFRKAVKALEKDTDFLSILGCVQNFETIKATFLKKETQLNLFKALANKPFASSTIAKERKPVIRSSKPKAEPANKKESNEKKLDIEKLFNNLQEMTKDDKKTFEDLKWDEKLVSNLVEEKHKESSGHLISNMKEIIQEREDKKQFDFNKKDTLKKLQLTKDDYEKINKKFE